MKTNKTLKNLKPYIPPILIDKLSLFRTYLDYKKYKKNIFKNTSFQNKHSQKRCFILGSGPSIKNQNLSLLKNEIVISLNNFYVHPQFEDIMSGDCSKYHLAAPIHAPQTEDEWTRWFVDMNEKISTNVNLVFGITRTPITAYEIIINNKLFTDHSLYWYYSGINSKKDTFKFKKSYIDIIKPILSADAASIYALIFAIYCGFENIYLLGMDHDYFLHDDETKMRFYKTAIHQKNELERTFGESFYTKEFFRQYSIFTQYELLKDNSSSNIFNASDGGILRVFKKVSYESLFD